MKATSLILFLAFFISGCQTVKIHDSKRGFTPSTDVKRGRILINSFKVPKEEGGTNLFMFLGALGGASTNTRYPVSVYDVTDEIKYVGTISGGNRAIKRIWLEYSAPIGMRRLMLSRNGRSNFPDGSTFVHADYIDVDVKSKQTHHVSLSQHGVNQHPYFANILISKKNRAFCSRLQKPNRDEMVTQIQSYMSKNKIDPDARDFVNYCVALSKAAVIFTPNKEAKKQFLVNKSFIKILHKENVKEWEKGKDRLDDYNLFKSYKEEPENDDA